MVEDLFLVREAQWGLKRPQESRRRGNLPMTPNPSYEIKYSRGDLNKNIPKLHDFVLGALLLLLH